MTRNDTRIIHTDGLEEGIRCAMCTNPMANNRGCDGGCDINESMYKRVLDVIKKNILEQEPCEDAVSRQAVIDDLEKSHMTSGVHNQGTWNECVDSMIHTVRSMPSVNPQKIGHCKDCKYFEYDSVAKVGGIPLIVAHEICNKWGDGCKTSEEGFCFLFEPQESEE